MRRALLVIAVVGVFAWLQIAKTIDQSNDNSEKPRVSEASPSTKANQDPPILKAEKKTKTQLARKFVGIYYGRDQLLFEGNTNERTQRYKNMLGPIVSEYFLKTYVRPLALSQDIQLVNAGGSVSAKIAYFNGGHDAEMLATIIRTVKTSQGTPSKIKTNIEITLIKEDDDWQVNSVSEVS